MISLICVKHLFTLSMCSAEFHIIMVLDNKTASSSPASEIVELPPSYDFATALPSSDAETSSSSGPSSSWEQSHDPPGHISHLFTGPPNADPLLGRSLAPTEAVASIEVRRKQNRIVTYDPRLSNRMSIFQTKLTRIADVLYDFLRAQTLIHPLVKIHCIGIHFETPERDEVVQDRGGHRHRRKGQPERIVDFDFTIDLSPVLIHPENLANIHLSVLTPEVPAFRGTFKHSPPFKGVWREWEMFRLDRGLPVWTDMRGCKEFWETRGKGKNTIALSDEEAELEGEGLLGQETLHEWCERYAADPGLLKESRLRKGIWGWDFAGLTTGTPDF